MWLAVIPPVIAFLLLAIWCACKRKQDVIETHETDARVLGILVVAALLCGWLLVYGVLLIGRNLGSQRAVWSVILLAPLVLPVALLPYSYFVLERLFKRNYGIQHECMVDTGAVESRVLVNELSQKLGLGTAPTVVVVPRKWGSPLVFAKSLKHAFLVLPSGFKEMVESASGGRPEIAEGLTRFIFLHELAHIKNKDVVFASWLACFLQVLGYTVPLAILSLILEGVLWTSGYPLMPTLGSILTPYIVLLLLADSFQRYRELLADARARLCMEERILSKLLNAEKEGGASPWESLLVKCMVSGALGAATEPNRKANLAQAIVHAPVALQQYVKRTFSSVGRKRYAPQIQARTAALKSGQYVNVESVLPSFEAALWNGIVASLLFFLSSLVRVSAEQITSHFDARSCFATLVDVFGRWSTSGALLYLVLAYSLAFRKETSSATRIRSYTYGLASRYCVGAIAGTLPIAALELLGAISLGLNWDVRQMGMPLGLHAIAFLLSLVYSCLCRLGDPLASLYRRKEASVLLGLLPAGLCVLTAFGILALWVGWFVTSLGIAIGMLVFVLSFSIVSVQGQPADQWVRFTLPVRGRLLAEVVRERHTTLICSAYLFVTCLSGTSLAIIILRRLAARSTVLSIGLSQHQMLGVAALILVASSCLYFYFALRQMSRKSEHTLREGHLLSESIFVLRRNPSDKDREKMRMAVSRCESRQGGFSAIYGKPAVCMDTTWVALSCLRACGLEPTHKAKHVAWTLRCENDEGGFSILSGLSSRLSATFYALDSLSALGSLKAVDAKKHAFWTRKWQTQEGGFYGPYSGWEPLTDTFFAVGSLQLLGQIESIDCERCAIWALNDWRKGCPTHERTYYLAKILDWLGHLSEEWADEIDTKYLRPYTPVMTQLRIEKHPGPTFYYLSCAEIVKGLHYIEQEMGRFANRLSADFSSFIQHSAKKLLGTDSEN